MYKASISIPFCYGHRLLHHPGKCQRLHGHNGRAEVTFGKEWLDAWGMVTDFTFTKQPIKAWIDDTLDHRMILQDIDPVCAALKALEEPFVSISKPPTAEILAVMILAEVMHQGWPVQTVRLWETPSSYAEVSPDILLGAVFDWHGTPESAPTAEDIVHEVLN